ncbi:MAG TPA: hypothetical protein VGM93_05075, partial [Acidimicrobiales bacterium]
PWHGRWLAFGTSESASPGGDPEPVVWQSVDGIKFRRLATNLPRGAAFDRSVQLVGDRLAASTALGSFASSDGRHWTRLAGTVLPYGGGLMRGGPAASGGSSSTSRPVEVQVDGSTTWSTLPRPSDLGVTVVEGDDLVEPQVARKVDGSTYLMVTSVFTEEDDTEVILRQGTHGRWDQLALPQGACGPHAPNRPTEDAFNTTELPAVVGGQLVVVRHCMADDPAGQHFEAFASRDDGRTWKPVDLPAAATRGQVEAIAPERDRLLALLVVAPFGGHPHSLTITIEPT